MYRLFFLSGKPVCNLSLAEFIVFAYKLFISQDRVINIQQVSFAAFELLIKFCYTGDTGLVAACKEDIREVLCSVDF